MLWIDRFVSTKQREAMEQFTGRVKGTLFGLGYRWINDWSSVIADGFAQHSDDPSLSR
jgi:hypothetical protein